MQELEAALIDIALNVEDMTSQGFVATMENLAARVGGKIEFDVRIDRDICVQRIASVVFADEGRVLLALSSDGQRILHIPLSDEVDGDFFRSLADWYALPLRKRAYINTDAAAVLLIGALRSKGLLVSAIPES